MALINAPSKPDIGDLSVTAPLTADKAILRHLATQNEATNRKIVEGITYFLESGLRFRATSPIKQPPSQLPL